MKVRQARAAVHAHLTPLVEGVGELQWKGRDLLVRMGSESPGDMPHRWLRFRPRDRNTPTGDTPASSNIRVLPEPDTPEARRAPWFREAAQAVVARDLEDFPPEILAAVFGPTSFLSLAVPGRCEQACVFCRSRPARPPRRRWFARSGGDAAFDELRKRLAEGRKEHTAVQLVGDDPLDYDRLPDLLCTAGELGYEEISLLTPGARFGDGATAARMAEAGLDTTEVALYGSTAEEHDRLVGLEGAFLRLIRGAALLRDRGALVLVHTVIADPVLGALALVAARAEEVGTGLCRLDGLRADRGAGDVYRRNVADLRSVRTALRSARHALPPRVTLDDVPDCALNPPLEGLVIRRAQGRPDPLREPDIHAAPCQRCTRRDRCPGVSEPYLAVHGDAGLHPFG